MYVNNSTQIINESVLPHCRVNVYFSRNNAVNENDNRNQDGKSSLTIIVVSN